jgi:hypothetical protein
MTSIAWLMFALFFPASLGILGQVLTPQPLHHQLLALGLFLLAIDQARMAVVDLEQIAMVKNQTLDPRLTRFYWVTISTIIIELMGFYLASQYLGIGILFVLGSQVWFNAIVHIQIDPVQANPIQEKPNMEKSLLFLANLLGMILIGLWIARITPMAIVLSLWAIAIAYGGIKVVQSFPMRLNQDENP